MCAMPAEGQGVCVVDRGQVEEAGVVGQRQRQTEVGERAAYVLQVELDRAGTIGILEEGVRAIDAGIDDGRRHTATVNGAALSVPEPLARLAATRGGVRS